MSALDISPGDRIYQAYDFETFSPTSSTALTASKYKPSDESTNGRAQVILISTSNSAAYRLDGGTPTATAGIQMVTGDTHRIRGYVNISNLKIISASGVVSVQYLR